MRMRSMARGCRPRRRARGKSPCETRVGGGTGQAPWQSAGEARVQLVDLGEGGHEGGMGGGVGGGIAEGGTGGGAGDQPRGGVEEDGKEGEGRGPGPGVTG